MAVSGALTHLGRSALPRVYPGYTQVSPSVYPCAFIFLWGAISSGLRPLTASSKIAMYQRAENQGQDLLQRVTNIVSKKMKASGLVASS